MRRCEVSVGEARRGGRDAQSLLLAEWLYVEAPGGAAAGVGGDGQPIVVAPLGAYALEPAPAPGRHRHPSVRPEQGQPGPAGQLVWPLGVPSHPYH